MRGNGEPPCAAHLKAQKSAQNAFKFGTEKNRGSRITAAKLRLPAKGGLTQFIGAAGPQARVAPLLYLSSHRWVSMVSFSCDNKAQRKASLFSHAGLFHASCHSLSFRCSVHSIHLPLIKLVDGKLDRQDRVEQTSVLLAPILRDDAGAFRDDEPAFLQLLHILPHGVIVIPTALPMVA